MFLEECKYDIKEIKIHNYITDDVEISSDSDEDNTHEETLWEKNFKQKRFQQKF